jgi:hypothetical protein
MGIGVSDELDRDRLLGFYEGRLASWSPSLASCSPGSD